MRITVFNSSASPEETDQVLQTQPGAGEDTALLRRDRSALQQIARNIGFITSWSEKPRMDRMNHQERRRLILYNLRGYNTQESRIPTRGDPKSGGHRLCDPERSGRDTRSRREFPRTVGGKPASHICSAQRRTASSSEQGLSDKACREGRMQMLGERALRPRSGQALVE